VGIRTQAKFRSLENTSNSLSVAQATPPLKFGCRPIDNGCDCRTVSSRRLTVRFPGSDTLNRIWRDVALWKGPEIRPCQAEIDV
jgi:hypothetical protein